MRRKNFRRRHGARHGHELQLPRAGNNGRICVRGDDELAARVTRARDKLRRGDGARADEHAALECFGDLADGIGGFGPLGRVALVIGDLHEADTAVIERLRYAQTVLCLHTADNGDDLFL